MNGEIESLLGEITERRKNAYFLLNQSAVMSNAPKCFNTEDQKLNALRVCRELNVEARAENDEADKLIEKFIRVIKNGV